MFPKDVEATLTEQLAYYCARALEYDQWWLRLGRYDRGPELNARWAAEAAQLAGALEDAQPSGRILELACGTGIWTERLLPFASELTAVDGSAEMLALNATRLQSSRLRYLQADLFRWRPSETFDFIFFGFWLSHVPPQKFEDFWRLIAAALAPGGRVFFLDSRRNATSTALDHTLPAPATTTMTRRLNDGREFAIYKVFYDPDDLSRRLENLGWQFDLHETPNYFLYGLGQRK